MYELLNSMDLADISIAHLDWEQRWFKAKNPFYRVWPKILPMLLGLDISKVPSRFCQLPSDVPELLIQLPVGNSLGLHCIIAANCTTRQGPGMILGAMDGEVDGEIGVPLVNLWVFGATDQPLRENLDSLRMSAPLAAETSVRDAVVSLVTTLCLIGDNPELLTPSVLAKDASRDHISFDAMVERARRRGRIGWEVGKDIEVAPHIRRPHPALVWTGEGRAVPKVVLRKGSVVHRSKVDQIPTGYHEQQ